MEVCWTPCWRKVRPLQDLCGLCYRHEGSKKTRGPYTHTHTLKTNKKNHSILFHFCCIYWSLVWSNISHFILFSFQFIPYYIRVLRSIFRIYHLRVCAGERYGLFKTYVDCAIGTKGVKNLEARTLTNTLWKRNKKTIPFHSISFHFCCMYWPFVWSNMSHFIPFVFHFIPYLYTRAKKYLPNRPPPEVCWRKVRPLQDLRELCYRHKRRKHTTGPYTRTHTLTTK